MKLYTILRNLIQGIKNALQEAKDYTDARGDYIVEEGTSGIWTYRKWASGIAECWGIYTTTATWGQTWGNVRYSGSSDAVSLPSGLFTDVPNASLNVSAPSLIASADMNSNSSTKDTLRVWIFTYNNTASATVKVNIQCKGLWKALEQVGGVILNLLNNRRVVFA